VEASVKNTIKSNQHYFDSTLPAVYRNMARVLNERGVYKSALEYIKESLASKPNEPFALDLEAGILEHLERYTECIAAEQSAIRESDGKYPWMQFQLGNCYFDTENWNQAEVSFRVEAEADKSDAPAAFNLGLSLLRQGYGGDARHWFQEALNRKPSDELRSKIMSALK
jgi:tetratricopeptide (TPR) repeat protein